MLHITLDTSIVEIKDSKATFSCTIAGVAEVLKDGDAEPTFEDFNEFKKLYFPWNWNFNNAKPQLLWIGKDIKEIDGTGTIKLNEYVSVLNETLPLTIQPFAKKNAEDKNEEILKGLYESKIEKILAQNKEGKFELKNYAKRKVENVVPYPVIEIKEDTKIDEKEISENIKPHFLSSTIAYSAQQLAPLNQELQLTFFLNCETDFVIPGNATHFLIYFPLGNYTIEKEELKKLKFNNEQLVFENNKLFIPYEIELKDGEKSLTLSQPITAIASYQMQDFIGELLLDSTKKDDNILTDIHKIIEAFNPGSIFTKHKNALFTFNGNTTLEVSDISALTSVFSTITQKFSFPGLLKKLITIVPFSEKINSEEELKEIKTQIVSLLNCFVVQMINGECQPKAAFVKAELISKETTSYKEKIDDVEVFDGDFTMPSNGWLFGEASKNFLQKPIENISKLVFAEGSEIDIVEVKQSFLIILDELEQIITNGKSEIYFYQSSLANNEDSQKKIKTAIENGLFSETIFKKNITDVSHSLDRKLYIKTFLKPILVEDNESKKLKLPEYINISEEVILNDLITDADWNTYFQTPESIPPPVNIFVQEIDTQTGSDLINEISGHIILSRRSKEKFLEKDKDNFEDWKYLNWAKVSLERTKKDLSKEIVYLKEDYLVPAVLPKINGVQKTSFHLSNESLSIVAGHDNQTGEDDVKDLMNFNYSFVDENGKNGVPAAPALWYGHYYEFAGFVALNSGALPKALRKSEDIYNEPTENIDNKQIEKRTEPYHHLRRVPVGLPNIQVFSEEIEKIDAKTNKKTKEKIYVNHYPKVPLLVNELIKNTSENIYERDKNGTQKKVEQKKISAYLLCGNDNQKQVTVTVDKPYTNFWNWYAHEGKKLNKDVGERFDKALEEEINIKEIISKNLLLPEVQREKVPKNPYLWETAIENELIVKVEQIFPKPTQEITKQINLENLIVKVDSDNDKTLPKNFVVMIEGDEVGFKNKNTITIPPGFICKISIHCRIAKNLFEEGKETQMFHSWMKNHIVPNQSDKKDENQFLSDGDFYLTNPEIFYVETAIKNNEIDKLDDFSADLYKGLSTGYLADSEYGVFCTLNDPNEKYKEHFPYFSRCEVQHQVWRWNGRLFAELKDTENLHPSSEKETTEAMKWEAWEFANRPDLTALQSNENITASFDSNGAIKSINQMIFKDQRPKNDAAKAHYFRFGLKIYNRYESIGDGYNEPYQAKDNGTLWKRYLKKMQLSAEQNKLPKPAIRFAIPLTDALQVTNADEGKVRAASMMIATYDRCFDEAGLSERFEVGIEVTSFEGHTYLQAGEDPILSDKAMGSVNADVKFVDSRDGRKFVAFQPVGPAALTFDMLAHSPKVVGSTFILNVEDIQQFLPDTAKLNAYAMVKVAVRRILKDGFVELISTEDNGQIITPKIKDFCSEWSASEWVQLLPAVDSLLPAKWKNAGDVLFTTNNNSLKISGKMPVFDITFEACMDRYIIISQKLDDIGGQPVEKYIGVYKWNSENSKPYEKPDELNLIFQTKLSKEKGTSEDTYKFENGFEGYARLMLVRKSQDVDDPTVDIWEKLFGSKSQDSIEFGKIENDPMAAMPLVSRRIVIVKQQN